MRCMACGGGMILVNVAQNDTMGISGFEHHTFTCSECRDIERRLVFTKHGREGGAEPTPIQAPQPVMPASTAQDERGVPSVSDTEPAPVQAPPIAPASTVQDEYVAPSVITEHNRECATELVPVHAAPLVAAPSTTQDEYVARSGVLSRVVAKIRGH